MNRLILRSISRILVFAVLAVPLFGQTNGNGGKFSYAAQKKFIPKELGEVYLGMPFDKFAAKIDVRYAEVGDTRFDWFELSIPLEKGNVKRLLVRIYGLSQDDKKRILRNETVEKTDDFGDKYEDTVDRVIVEKVDGKGFIYAMYVNFEKEFDLKSHVIKTFGKDGEIRKSDDPYHFFDIQWVKKTPDGLNWLIRSFHDGDSRTLQLLGRIDGTEWGID
ncbi:MAG: hypothetical protein R2681_02075 [Pyrinomonadaceae bacterium]